MNSFFNVRKAIVRDVASSIVDGLKQEIPESAVNPLNAKSQHDRYTELLRSLDLQITELAADESHPDCCFVEDTAVVIGNLAAISFLGAKERQGEEVKIREALKNQGITTEDIRSPATIDGGDVLYTGSHLFVGLSKRTNQQGADQLAKIFKEIPVVTVPVHGTLHLKSVLSAFDKKTLVFGTSKAALDILDYLEKQVPLNRFYQIVKVPNIRAANVLSINEHIVMQEGYPETEAIFRKLAVERKMKIHKTAITEFFKVDGALTCCSLLF